MEEIDLVRERYFWKGWILLVLILFPDSLTTRSTLLSFRGAFSLGDKCLLTIFTVSELSCVSFSSGCSFGFNFTAIDFFLIFSLSKYDFLISRANSFRLLVFCGSALTFGFCLFGRHGVIKYSSLASSSSTEKSILTSLCRMSEISMKWGLQSYLFIVLQKYNIRKVRVYSMAAETTQ